MKKCFRRKIPAAPSVLLAAALLFGLFPPFTAAQTGERVETGRFGAEEGEAPQTMDENEITYTNKWLYLGARLGPSLRFYTPSGDTLYTGGDTYGFAMDVAFQANLQIRPFLSVQGEMVFTWDNASLWAYRLISNNETERYTWDYSTFTLQFPLTARLNFYPGKFRLSPFLGFYFLVPLGNLKQSTSLDDDAQSVSYRISPPLGFLGGLNGAMKLGPGMIFADLRYALDGGEPESRDGEIRTYQRSMISLTIGYEYGFFTKNRGAEHE
jgi:hypothetical protein